MGTRIVPLAGVDFVTVALGLGPAPAGGAVYTITNDNPGIVSYSSPVNFVEGEQEKEVELTGLQVGTVTLSAQLTEYDGSPPSPAAPVRTLDVEVQAVDVVKRVVELEVTVQKVIAFP